MVAKTVQTPDEKSHASVEKKSSKKKRKSVGKKQTQNVAKDDNDNVGVPIVDTPKAKSNDEKTKHQMEKTPSKTPPTEKRSTPLSSKNKRQQEEDDPSAGEPEKTTPLKPKRSGKKKKKKKEKEEEKRKSLDDNESPKMNDSFDATTEKKSQDEQPKTAGNDVDEPQTDSRKSPPKSGPVNEKAEQQGNKTPSKTPVEEKLSTPATLPSSKKRRQQNDPSTAEPEKTGKESPKRSGKKGKEGEADPEDAETMSSKMDGSLDDATTGNTFRDEQPKSVHGDVDDELETGSRGNPSKSGSTGNKKAEQVEKTPSKTPVKEKLSTTSSSSKKRRQPDDSAAGENGKMGKESPKKSGEKKKKKDTEEEVDPAQDMETEPTTIDDSVDAMVEGKSQDESPMTAVGDVDDEAETGSRGNSPTWERKKMPAVSKPPPVMNVSIHRMRHLNYRPKPILCLATTPFHSQSCDYVAVSRENGHVELKSPDEKWRTVAQIAGMSSRPVDVMVWVCDDDHKATSNDGTTTFVSMFHQTHTQIHARRTLVGASRDGTLFVLDFARGRHAAVTGSGGGGVFSLIRLGGNTKGSSCLVAAGCEDGSIRIHRVDREHTRLVLVSTIPCAGAPILSLACQRNNAGGTILYAGVADGTIRRHECGSGTHASDHLAWKSAHRMTVENYGRGTPTRVWALAVLSDGTVVSGDSLGHVQFWDGNSGTLIHSFEQNSSKADVLDLVVTEDERRVFASGVDSRVVCIERSSNKWILTQAMRIHTHDVKALAIFRLRDRTGRLQPPPGECKEVLCSGGIDAKICSYMIHEFRKQRPKNWFPWPTLSPVSVAKEGRVVLFMREDSIELHKLNPETPVEPGPALIPEGESLIGTMDIKGTHNLVCSDISPDGKMIVLSNGLKTLLFDIEYVENEDGSLGFLPKEVAIPSDRNGPSLAVKFVSKQRVACTLSEGPIVVLEKVDPEEAVSAPREVARFTSHLEQESVMPHHSLSVSHDGKWLATARSGVGSGTVHVFRLQGGHYWSVPALEAPISAVGFLGDSLVVVCSNFAFYVFDLVKRRLSKWSKDNGVPVGPHLPAELRQPFDYPVRIATNPSKNGFLVGSFGCFCVVSMDKGMPRSARVVPECHVRGRKRKRAPQSGAADATTNCTVCLRYNSMLCLDYVSKDEILVVEQPWLNVVSSFPAALERKIYGS